MKKLILSIIFVMFTPLVGAHAEAPDLISSVDDNAETPVYEFTLDEHADQSPVTQSVSDIRILGRGVVDKKTGDSIALVCQNPTCTQARFGIFPSKTKDFQWVGATLNVPQAPQQRLKKKAFKLMMKRFFVTHTTQKYQEAINQARSLQQVVCFTGISIPGFFVIISTGLVSSAALSLLGLSLLIEFVIEKSDSLGMVQAIAGAGFTFNESSFDNKNGWNWIDHAKRISNKKFDIMSDLVQVPAENQGIPQKTLNKITALQAKGVQF